jgi:hypothetical protein
MLFQQLPGSQPTIISRMNQEIQRVYSTLITRVHRKPRTAFPDQLPVLIGAVDLPVYKSDRASSPLVRCNGGLHFHALRANHFKIIFKPALRDRRDNH